jgi:hypothetical protein
MNLYLVVSANVEAGYHFLRDVPRECLPPEFRPLLRLDVAVGKMMASSDGLARDFDLHALQERQAQLRLEVATVGVLG